MGDNTWKIGEAVEIPEEAIKIALENEMSLSDRFYLLAKRSPFLLAGMFLVPKMFYLNIYYIISF